MTFFFLGKVKENLLYHVVLFLDRYLGIIIILLLILQTKFNFDLLQSESKYAVFKSDHQI